MAPGNSFDMPAGNSGIGLFNNNPILLDNQKYLLNMMRLENIFKYTEPDNISSTMSPSTSRIENMTVFDDLNQLGQTNESENYNTTENYNLNSSMYSEISKRMNERLNSVNLS